MLTTDGDNTAPLISESQTTSQEITASEPPDWQRVPQIRSHKRKKLSQSMSPESVITQNRFSDLPIDQKENDTQPKEKRPSKPPPIILYGIEEVNCLTELLKSVADGDSFTYKIVNKNQLRISCKDVPTYKTIITIVREKGLVGHTFNLKDQRCYRIVIRNLHHSTPTSAITEEIERTGNTVYGEIINVKYGPEKKPTSTFFVNVAPGPNNKAVKDIKYIYHQSVTIEDPKKKTTLPQCQRCQQYGHSKNYCMRPYRCVKCAESHKTSDCPKKDRRTPALCALCQGAHPANYKGCEVYKEILARKKPRNAQPKPINLSPNDIPSTTPHNPSDNKSTGLTYADKLKQNYSRPETNISNKLEELILKQSEKFDIILQQMSTLLSLITTLLDKLTK